MSDTRQLGYTPHPALEALQRLLGDQAIDMAFQPIVDLRDASITGYEALARPDEQFGFESPDELFEAAVATGCAAELEQITRRKALDALATWDPPTLLFLNNTPGVFMSDNFERVLREEVSRTPNVDPTRVVLEITEKATNDFRGDVGLQAMMLRENGFHTAIDDVGAGISGLNQITCLRPNWVKLDRQLIADIDFDLLKQNLIRFFVHFARLSDMQLVAEGIERLEELEVLIRLGVTHGQGFYLGRPAITAEPLAPAVIASVAKIHEQAENRSALDSRPVRVDSLTMPVMTCCMEDSITDVLDRVRHHTNPEGTVVLHGRRVLGWLDRSALEAAEQEGRAEDPVRCLALRDLGKIGADVSIPAALEIVASQPEHRQAWPSVVLDHGKVAGILPLRRLLVAAADSYNRPSVRLAVVAGLPDRVHGDTWIQLRCTRKAPGGLAFIDLRDFDAYSMAYGPEMGEAMLARLVSLIRHHFDHDSSDASFMAYLGEDRFVVHVPEDGESALVEIIEQFSTAQSEFFSATDYAAHAFSYTDSSGQERTSPLTTARVVFIRHAYRQFDRPRDIHRLALQLRMRTIAEGTVGHEQIICDRRDDDSIKRRRSA